MWPTASQLADLWSYADAKAYQYAWLVLPTFIYLLGWYHRDRVLAMTPRPGSAGLPLALVAGGLWLAAFSADFKLGQQLALVLALQAVALYALGGETYSKLLPTMLLLFLMIPCGDIATPPLRDLTLTWLEWFAVISGLPHAVDGYYISFGEYHYVVWSACSGLGFFTLAGFLGYSYGLLICNSLPKVLGMAAIGAALGIVTNAIRVSLIVAIDMHNGTQMDMAGHTDIQWLLMLALLGVMLLLVTMMRGDAWCEADAAPN
jgi:exosortase